MKNCFRILLIVQVGLLLTFVPLNPGVCSQGSDRKKVLFVNSYDLDFPWSMRLLRGALKILDVKIDERSKNLDDTASPFQFKLHDMKTKNAQSEAFKQKAGLEAKALIESWRPDVVICADDNASKYLIVPYFRNSDIPFVFCGVNWSAAEYGFPCANVTGMIEVFPVQETLTILKPYAKGDRVGFLAHDTLSEQKNASYIRDIFKLDMVIRLVSSMDELILAFKEIQQVSDILLVGEVVSTKGFDDDRFFEITNRYTTIPTARFSPTRIRNVLLSSVRVAEEQGEWAATTAMSILNGKSPRDIPITMNRKAGITLNMKLAKKLNIKFPMELIERATFVSEVGQ